MSGLTLSLKEAPRQRVNLSGLTKAIAAGKTAKEIAALKLTLGNRKCALGDLFKVTGRPGTRLVIDNCTDRIDGIGAKWSGGNLIVQGNAGAYLGKGMTGGDIHVYGNAGAYVASAMRDGHIHVEGDAGDFIGAPQTGIRVGMNGGVVRVEGNAGDRVGDQMRRGVILIEGDVGSHCASRMIAGSLAVLGDAGPNLGLGMRRGTVLLMKPPSHLPATFNDCGSHALPFFHLFLSYIESLAEGNRAIDPSRDRLHRYAGDLAVDGKGEILFYNY